MERKTTPQWPKRAIVDHIHMCVRACCGAEVGAFVASHLQNDCGVTRPAMSDPHESADDPSERVLLTHLDTIAAWLALEDPWPRHIELMLLFGGSMPPTWETAVGAVAAGEVGTLMVVGGRGHTTDALLVTMDLDPTSAQAQGTSEAEVIAAWLRDVHGSEDVLLETRSTNCGNNVTLAEQVAAQHGLRPRTVALVQDPTMQRRDGRTLPTYLVPGGRGGGEPARPGQPRRVALAPMDVPRDGRGTATP